MLYNTAIGILTCLLFVIIVIIFNTIVIKLYIKKVKEHNSKEIEFQKTLNKTILETQEQVLENISQDLHDDIGQQLTFLNFQLEKIKLNSNEHIEELDKVSESVSKVSDSVRGLSHSLNSNFLFQNNLGKAIAKEVDRIKKHSDIQVSFESKPTEYKLNNTEKIILYRIFQEVIANALKHADASKIDISIQQNKDFQFVIKDNGKGFDIEDKDQNNSLGLINMKTRCGIIGFDFHIASQKNIGTEITITKKIPPNE